MGIILATVLMKNIQNYFTTAKFGRSTKQFTLTVNKGKFKGIVLKFVNAKFDKKEDDVLNIEYEVLANPKGIPTRNTAIEKNLGDFIISAITHAMKQSGTCS